jgi:hypothetical protein
VHAVQLFLEWPTDLGIDVFQLEETVAELRAQEEAIAASAAKLEESRKAAGVEKPESPWKPTPPPSRKAPVTVSHAKSEPKPLAPLVPIPAKDLNQIVPPVDEPVPAPVPVAEPDTTASSITPEPLPKKDMVMQQNEEEQDVSVVNVDELLEGVMTEDEKVESGLLNDLKSTIKSTSATNKPLRESEPGTIFDSQSQTNISTLHEVLKQLTGDDNEDG